MNWKIEQKNRVIVLWRRKNWTFRMKCQGCILSTGRISLPSHPVPPRLANHWEAGTGSRS